MTAFNTRYTKDAPLRFSEAAVFSCIIHRAKVPFSFRVGMCVYARVTDDGY